MLVYKRSHFFRKKNAMYAHMVEDPNVCSEKKYVENANKWKKAYILKIDALCSSESRADNTHATIQHFYKA